MLDDSYLRGSIYHMVHLSNLGSILQRRALLSRDSVYAEGIKYRSIADEDVQELRDRVFIWDFSEKRWRSLHSYVPFYFAERTPMLFKLRGMQHNILFFEVDRSILQNAGVIFTDGNITNQQLAKYKTERVDIVPATARNSLCQRRYSSGEPLGTNPNRSNVYADPMFLENLQWDIINESDGWGGDSEKKRIRHAEVLVPDSVPLSKLEGIATRTQETADKVNIIIKWYGLEGHVPRAVRKSDLYF